MAVVEEGTCEGCGKTFAVDELHVVTISDEEVVCCAECRRHAERAASQAKPSCEGCGAPTAADNLAAVVLPDGVEIDCCPDCRTEANVDLTEDSPGDHRSGASAQTTAESSTQTDSRERRANTDQTGVSHNVDSQDGDSGEKAETSQQCEGDGNSTEQTQELSTTDSESRPAKTANICDNCKESYTIELYRVETIDGRTEEFCPECKRDGVDRGIVRDVQLRRAQAFEVLGLNSAADEDTVREAFLRQIKEVHPDREDGNRSEFMLVKRAYERLSDET